jgi:hypothetical protein
MVVHVVLGPFFVAEQEVGSLSSYRQCRWRLQWYSRLVLVKHDDPSTNEDAAQFPRHLKGFGKTEECERKKREKSRKVKKNHRR